MLAIVIPSFSPPPNFFLYMVTMKDFHTQEKKCLNITLI